MEGFTMKKVILILLTAFLCLVTACKPNTASPTGSSAPGVTATVTGSETVPPEHATGENISYPLKNAPTFTWAIAEDATISTVSHTFAETPYIAELEKRTGVKLVIQHPTDFSLLFASGDLPDLVTYYPNSYPGGASKMITDKVASPIEDQMHEFAPDFAKAILSNETWRKGSTTPSGNIVGFPMIRGDEKCLVSAGLMIRKDWLDDLNLEAPATPEELVNVLTRFKEEKGATVPLSISSTRVRELFDLGMFTSPFGIPRGAFFQRDGKVFYGYYMDEYKDYLTFMNNLYTKELLDNNFNTIDNNIVNANFMNGAAGFTYSSVGGGMGNFLATMETKDPNYDLMGIPGLVAKRGDKPMAGQKESPNQGLFTIITTACKDKESAMKYLNYNYTEEGHMLNNFGIEGVSYNMINGYPTYSDEIMKNPDGLTMQQAMSKYCRSWAADAFIQDGRYMEQFGGRPQQKAALAAWADNDSDKYLLPYITLPAEFTAEYSKIASDVNTYISESYQKFIIGAEPLDTGFDKYMATLKSMGIERMIELQQMALDEYNSR